MGNIGLIQTKAVNALTLLNSYLNSYDHHWSQSILMHDRLLKGKGDIICY